MSRYPVSPCLVFTNSNDREVEVDYSNALSPLTSLSSLGDRDSVPPFSMEPTLYSMDDVNFAQVRDLSLPLKYAEAESVCGLRYFATSGCSAPLTLRSLERAVHHPPSTAFK